MSKNNLHHQSIKEESHDEDEGEEHYPPDQNELLEELKLHRALLHLSS